jgi:heme/copper-type cytochrome/quinol oxidase subunit 1
MFDNSSSVLWTFYPPLKGSVFFYLGMTLVVSGSLLPLPIVLDLRARWKALRPGELTPLVTYMSTATMLMWLPAAGGAGGIVLGSWQLDNIVHNTTWIPGHFHITAAAQAPRWPASSSTHGRQRRCSSA